MPCGAEFRTWPRLAGSSHHAHPPPSRREASVNMVAWMVRIRPMAPSRISLRASTLFLRNR